MTTDIEKQLTETNLRFRIATRTAKLGYWVFDLKTSHVEVSEELLHQLGLAPDFTWTLQSWKERLHPDDYDRAMAQLETVTDGSPNDYFNVYRLRHANGGYRWIESIGDFIYDDDGKLVRMIGTHQDITRRIEIEQALDAALENSIQTNEALQRSNQELEQFAYVASHDLRSPLRGLQNLASWIKEDMDDAGQEVPESVNEHLSTMGKQIERMQALLDGLLAYARIDQSYTSTEPVDLNQIAEEAIAFVEAPPNFHVHLASDLPTIIGNFSPVMRVVVNLIDNAIKHHPGEKGEVVIRGGMSDDGMAELIVEDDGAGIPKEHRERVFRMFETLGKNAQSGKGGMGLAMVRKLVLSCGGTIEFGQSELGGAAAITRWPTNQSRPKQAKSPELTHRLLEVITGSTDPDEVDQFASK
ncbi:PAS domain-containing sensor histidine kinase [Rhodopirellula sp. JC740]|uniref:histidine kinase n=1 Tax=Rhodopirellula halodulae TaxID=2894198 RepID=A0ABS8NCS9_9BACT|nr:PAS domain-containing sensor histidine kinase [Rhodopirellula sp. JC740]MCC9640747.1 PAS domain-containing sensor histidine kinase [Rhodopirellula sp. JC740]